MIRYLDALAGAGKTHALMRLAHRMARSGKRVIVLMPTTELIDRTVAGELGALTKSYRVVTIHGGTAPHGVVSAIDQYLKGPLFGGEVLFVTHAAFLALPYFHRRSDWHVICDEVMSVESFDELNLSDTHHLITPYLDIKEAGAVYARIIPKNGFQSALTAIARNRRGDDLLARLEAVARRVGSPDWDTYVRQAQYSELVTGTGSRSQLAVYGVLKPTVFDGFASVTIASACFTCTMLHHLWSAHGQSFAPISSDLTGSLRYDAHPNGASVTIYYASETPWSKYLRDKPLEGCTGSVLHHISDAIVQLLGSANFVWMGNKDIPDSFFGSSAIRLPNVPHGRNDYQHIHDAVILSALNPAPAHFSFLQHQGVDDDAVRTAIYRQAVYQAIARTSVRNPNDHTPKRLVVMDRDTAEWLASLFIGCRVERLPGLSDSLLPQARVVGRTREFPDDAARQKAHRKSALLQNFRREGFTT